ncbi:DNA-binding GntR family transcriptional regulator [Nocardia transvalensis]|uniref:DNA-binding GntR family transcriptional regulator n=1 Tax=Nocardia transvalensis TaxID=37333 RepID=A0A7W9PF75_9NOCA|nr:GntR family transcriptional regulator [Nocardia transvalensis]MBB5914528.1 DNA-binding GntR family transcriptional regulator [Nocardia transvalensis]
MTDAAADGALLGESVHRQLRQLVLSGELGPGTALSVPGLSARLGVSRSPVREAVQQLIYEGLAVAVPHAGARVATIDDRQVCDVLAVRAVLDGLAAATAAVRVTAAELAELNAMLSAQEANLRAAADAARDTELDLEFHAFIRDRCGNRTLADELARMEAQAHLYRGDLWRSESNRRTALREHRRIVEALESGHPDDARAAAEAHVRGLITRLGRR